MMKLEALMDQYYDTFTTNEKHICTCILQHTKDCANLSIDEFAQKYYISTSALSRFAQKLNLSGYRDIRSILRFRDQEDTSSMDTTTMLSCYERVIDEIEQRDCTTLFEKMKNAKRIFILGEGYSLSRVAKEMKRVFIPTGKQLYDLCGCDCLPFILNVINEQDIIFILSLHGEREELYPFVKQLKMRKITTVSITEMKSNHLAHLCDENLYIPSTSFTLQDFIYEVRTPYFILIELLYVKYRLYCNYEHIPKD